MPIRGATDADGLVGVQVLRLCGACLRWAGVYLFIFRGVLHYKRAGNLVSTEAAGYINRKGEGGKWERGGQKKEVFRDCRDDIGATRRKGEWNFDSSLRLANPPEIYFMDNIAPSYGPRRF